MNAAIPLPERLRPKCLEEYVGQKHLTKPPGGLLWKVIQRGIPRSILFWGPPGCGKTTLAKLYMKSFSHPIETLSGTSSATCDFRKVIDKVDSSPLLYRPSFVWIDEVHRLTRPQQDLLLHSVEEGSLILVAATTENPSFQLSSALLSRCQVMTLVPLDALDLEILLGRISLPLVDEAKKALCSWAQGDARTLLNWADLISQEKSQEPLTVEMLAKIMSKKQVAADPTGEGRYQLISALHKAVRGSDCQAALYWFCRQCVAGEDLRYIARRLIRMASEDIGLADPQALGIALQGMQGYEALGSPEGDLILAQVVIYLSCAPKSNAAYVAFNKAKESAEKTSCFRPPLSIINAPTKWMKQEGFGVGYQYDHDYEHGYSGQTYFPDQVPSQEFYQPVERGFERELTKRLAYFCKLREAMCQQKASMPP